MDNVWLCHCLTFRILSLSHAAPRIWKKDTFCNISYGRGGALLEMLFMWLINILAKKAFNFFFN